MNELTDFTFKDTGITVKIRKVSPMLAYDIDRSIPHPQPPFNKVDYGPPVGIKEERNESDPAYQRALQERFQKVGMATTRATILRGVNLDGCNGWKEQVKEYRKWFKDTTGMDMPETEDKAVFILNICTGTEDDLTDLVRAITTRSQPTQEAVAEAKASFPDQV